MTKPGLPELENLAPRELNRAELEAVSGGGLPSIGGRWWGFDPPGMTNKDLVITILGQSGTGVKWPLGDPKSPLKQD